MESLPELKVTVFSDYICPFCYVGHHRLMRLRDSYDLKINWCFIEIHPENSAAGEPVADLDYPSDFWDRLIRKTSDVSRQKKTFHSPSIPLPPIQKMRYCLPKPANTSGAKFFIDCMKNCSRRFLSIRKTSVIAKCSLILLKAVAWTMRALNRHGRTIRISNACCITLTRRANTKYKAYRVLCLVNVCSAGVVGENVMRSAAAELSTQTPPEKPANQQSLNY